MTDVVGQGESLCQLTVQTEGCGERAGDLGYFEGVSEATAEMVAGQIVSQAGEYLGFSREATKGARMENAGAITRKGRAIKMGRLGMYTGGKGAVAIDGDVSGQRVIEFCQFCL